MCSTCCTTYNWHTAIKYPLISTGFHVFNLNYGLLNKLNGDTIFDRDS